MKHICANGLVLVSAMVAMGCSESQTNSDAAPAHPTYYRDVKPLVDAKCGNCHAAGGIAPFALSTYDEVKSVKGAVVAAVEAKTMPPWLASDDCNSYNGDRSLTDEQIATISKWVADGAPEGDPADKPIDVDNPALSLSRVDLELKMPVAYTPVVSPDEYRCFFIDWPETETKYVTGLGVQPGEMSIVHHVIAFLAPPDTLADFQALDDAEPAPGWSCFGGPGGATNTRAAWIGAWAPGGSGADFPAGTGIEVPVGSKLVVQLHYNTLSAPAVPDQTGLLLKIDPSVEKKAVMMPFADIDWVKNHTMTIPAHTNDVKHETASDPTKFVGIITGGAVSSNVPLTVYSAGLHMHTYGKSARTTLMRADGTEQCLLDIPRWNFHWQSSYELQKPLVMEPGDQLHLGCTWDNPEMTDLNWGEGTGDEMCLGVFYVSE